MAFTTRVKETGQVFQATTDMGPNAEENRIAALPIEPNHTYSGHLFDTYVKTNPVPSILRYSGYEQATLDGRELEEISFDKLTLVPKTRTPTGSPTPQFEDDLITIRLVSRELSDETELKRYLEEALGTKVFEQFTESAHWTPPILVIRTAAISATAYAGKKLLDLLVDLLRDWIKNKPNVPEIVLFDADGNEIKIPRK